MRFTKPKIKSPAKSIEVGVVIIGDTVVVSPCESHPRTDIIKAKQQTRIQEI